MVTYEEQLLLYLNVGGLVVLVLFQPLQKVGMVAGLYKLWISQI